jgi:hypothetical protein
MVVSVTVLVALSAQLYRGWLLYQMFAAEPSFDLEARLEDLM